MVRRRAQRQQRKSMPLAYRRLCRAGCLVFSLLVLAVAGDAIGAAIQASSGVSLSNAAELVDDSERLLDAALPEAFTEEVLPIRAKEGDTEDSADGSDASKISDVLSLSDFVDVISAGDATNASHVLEGIAEAGGTAGAAGAGGAGGTGGIAGAGDAAETVPIYELRHDQEASVVGFSCKEESSTTMAALRDCLAARSWVEVPSGTESCTSFVKQNGRYRWVFLQCVQVGEWTSVVVQYSLASD